MNPLTLIFRLPLLPLRGLIQLAELIRDEADQELHDPARVRRQLEQIEEARARGEISDEEVAQAEREAISRLVPTSGTAGMRHGDGSASDG
jgi:cytochrome c-type biogenesis protein CcmH/NrfG